MVEAICSIKEVFGSSFKFLFGNCALRIHSLFVGISEVSNGTPLCSNTFIGSPSQGTEATALLCLVKYTSSLGHEQ